MLKTKFTRISVSDLPEHNERTFDSIHPSDNCVRAISVFVVQAGKGYMVSFGLIDDWQPRTGKLTIWSASEASVDAAGRAPIHQTPPSHQQEEYLRTALRKQKDGVRGSRLYVGTFDSGEQLDPAAMTTTINTFLRRHDTHLSWFSAEADGSMARHVIHPDDVDFIPHDFGMIDSAEDLRNLAQSKTPGPLEWNCFTFGTIEHADGFTMYAAIDHLHSDPMSQAISLVDAMTLYSNAADPGSATEPRQPGSYIEYCRRERETSAQLSLESESVQRWIELVRDNGGDLPTFPLSLGPTLETEARSAHLTAELFDDDDAKVLSRICRDNRAGFIAAVLTVAGLAAHEFTGCDRYLAITPKSTRTTPEEFSAVGWFTSLIPVPIEFAEDSTFCSLVRQTQSAYLAGRKLSDVSFHRVLELLDDTPDSPITTQPGWSVPMVSVMDTRRMPGVDTFAAINAKFYGNRGTSEEVYVWVNRFTDHTSMSLLFPDSSHARASVDIYVDRIRQIFKTIVAEGDYTPATVPAGAV